MNETSVLMQNLLIVTCAISAGVHAALVPSHLDESTSLGLGFALAAGLLFAAALAVR
jgi:drug/metabolite transporter (DMT)-like permease